MGGYYLVKKHINKNFYWYYQTTWREGSKVKCHCIYVGPVNKIARPLARRGLASTPKASMNVRMENNILSDWQNRHAKEERAALDAWLKTAMPRHLPEWDTLDDAQRAAGMKMLINAFEWEKGLSLTLFASSPKASVNEGIKNQYPGDPAAEGNTAIRLNHLRELQSQATHPGAIASKKIEGLENQIAKASMNGGMKKKWKEEVDTVMDHLRNMGHDFDDLDSGLIVMTKEVDAEAIKDRMYDAQMEEILRKGAEGYNIGACETDDEIYSKTSKGGITTLIDANGKITHKWDNDDVNKPRLMPEISDREERKVLKSIAEKGYYESAACKKAMAKMEKESEKTRLICLYDKLTRPCEGSIYEEARQDFIDLHAAAIEAKGADATNLCWVQADFSIASKTDKGIVTTTIHEDGKITHKWNNDE